MLFFSAARLINRKKCRNVRLTEALPSSSVIESGNGQSICGYVRLGLCELEAGFLSGKAGFCEISGYYGTRLNSVELNYTFRRFPAAKLLNGWIEATPADFKFAVKAHQNITHIKRLRDTYIFHGGFSGGARSFEGSGQVRSGAVSTAALLEMRSGAAEGFSGKAAAADPRGG